MYRVVRDQLEQDHGVHGVYGHPINQATYWGNSAVCYHTAWNMGLGSYTCYNSTQFYINHMGKYTEKYFSLNLKFDFEGNIPDRYSNEKWCHISIIHWKTISSKERWLMIVCVLTAFVCHFVCDILDEILDSLGHWRHHQWQIRPDDNSCQSPISQSLLQLQICDGTCEAKIRPHYVRR